GRDDLHHRRRIHRLRHVVRYERGPAIEGVGGNDQRRDRRWRDAGACESLGHRRRQLARPRCQWQDGEQDREEPPHEPSFSTIARAASTSSANSGSPVTYGGMKYTVLPMGRSSTPRSSASSKARAAKSGDGSATSNAQIIPRWRKS